MRVEYIRLDDIEHRIGAGDLPLGAGFWKSACCTGSAYKQQPLWMHNR